MTIQLQQAENILQSAFGHTAFRPLQKEILQSVLQKKDTLVVMPTGGGKSLCYQIPALLFDGLTIVVSPLISLMSDQITYLTKHHIAAIVLNSTLSATEYQTNIARLRRGEIKLLYIAPETLLKPNILTFLASLTVDCLTIDEAHCISEWGHDFRPDYRHLALVRKQFQSAVCIALTATATVRVRTDIQEILHFAAENAFIASFDRSNLLLRVVKKTNPLMQARLFLEKFPKQAGIIYCLSRKQVDELCEYLQSLRFKAVAYHAGLPESMRARNQQLFFENKALIMVATVAFGMGINKPDVRFVVHYDLPKSIESYYQEIGRSGRDGQPAECLLLFARADIRKVKYFISQKSPAEQRVAERQLSALVAFAEASHCRRVPLLHYFGEKYPVTRCGACDYCVHQLAVAGKSGKIALQIPD
jgi:ATP-dependent DNA helicase RecQ